jgi:hypothetical protein
MKLFTSEIKKLLVWGTLAVFPVLGGFGLLEWRLSKIPNSYAFKRDHLLKNTDIDVLILGSSSEEHGINPALLNCKTFNLSNASQSLIWNSQLFLKYVDQLPKLKLMALAIHYYAYGYQMAGSDEEWRLGYYLKEYP